jgi:hypothetical protein
MASRQLVKVTDYIEEALARKEMQEFLIERRKDYQKKYAQTHKRKSKPKKKVEREIFHW